MGCADKTCDFKPVKMQRRKVGANDVEIDMKFCGVCHSDVACAAHHNPFYMLNSPYPCVPGHELAGIVKSVGANVTKFKVGDKVGVGCLVNSCKKCGNCKKGQENECLKLVMTYGQKVKKSEAPNGYTLGGYTNVMVVDEHFAIPIPESYPLEKAGPVMCAGVTMYDPLKKYNCGPGTRLAIVGLGGLGQMGIKLGKILGAEVTVISRSPAKEKIATGFGADHFLVSTNADQMAKAKGSFDLILNTIPLYHKYTEYSPLLAKKGNHVLIGLHNGTLAGVVTDKVTCGATKIPGSMIGGIPATVEVMELVAEHGIMLETELVGVDKINSVFEKLDSNNDSGIRYVLDIGNTLNEGAYEKCKDVPPPKLQPHKHGITLFGVTREFLWQLCTFKWW